MLTRPEFATYETRLAYRDVNALIGERFRTGTVDHRIEQLSAAGVPCSRVRLVPAIASGVGR